MREGRFGQGVQANQVAVGRTVSLKWGNMDVHKNMSAGIIFYCLFHVVNRQNMPDSIDFYQSL